MNQPCRKPPLDNHLNSNDNPGNDTGLVFYSTTSHGNTAFPRAIGVASTTGGTVNLLYGGEFAPSWQGHNIIIGGADYKITAVNSAKQITVSPSPGTLPSVNYYFTLYPGGGYDEVDGLVGGGSTPAPGYKYRFAYTYNTALSPYFSTQNAITSCSQTGKYCFVSTDWQCSLGTTNGTNSSYCAPDWPASTQVAVNAFIWPQIGNAFKYVFQTNASCVTGAAEPGTWPQNLGGEQVDGSCTWTNIGTYRGDVVAVINP
jgi:hypothetical protein